MCHAHCVDLLPGTQIGTTDPVTWENGPDDRCRPMPTWLAFDSSAVISLVSAVLPETHSSLQFRASPAVMPGAHLHASAHVVVPFALTSQPCEVSRFFAAAMLYG